VPPVPRFWGPGLEGLLRLLIRDQRKALVLDESLSHFGLLTNTLRLDRRRETPEECRGRRFRVREDPDPPGSDLSYTPICLVPGSFLCPKCILVDGVSWRFSQQL
jgi:hypothetical protein